MVSSILAAHQENSKPLLGNGNRHYGSTPATYSGPPDPQLESLVDRTYSCERSRLVDRWLTYRDAEFVVAPLSKKGGAL